MTGVSDQNGAENGLWTATSKDVTLEMGLMMSLWERSKGLKYFSNQKLTDEPWECTNKELAQRGAPG